MNVKRKILLVLFISYIVELLFTLFELDAETRYKFHPLFDGVVFQDGSKWNGEKTPANFVYGFMEIAARGLIFLAAYWASKAKIFLPIFLWLACLEIADMVDYWLLNNSGWFAIYGPFEFDFNLIKVGVVLGFNVKEWMIKS